MPVSHSSRRAPKTSSPWRRTIRHQFPGLLIVMEAPRELDLHQYAEALYNQLAARYPQVLLLSDPGDTTLSQAIRPLLEGQRDLTPLRTESQILLRAAARTELVHQFMLPALRNGTITLCERFLWSTQVYQGNSIRDYELIRTLHRFTTDDLTPDYTFFLDRADPVTSTQPRSEACHQEAFSRLTSSDPAACSIVDAAQPPSMVADIMATILQRHFEPLLTTLRSSIDPQRPSSFGNQ